MTHRAHGRAASVALAVAVAVSHGDARAERRSATAAPPPAYDGLQQLLSDAGFEALARGDYPRAFRLFRRLLKIDPSDARASREYGRAAHALGHYEVAVQALGRAAKLRRGVPDPEIHYLRGEALLTLGRRSEGLRELAQAEREIGPRPAAARPALWLARIYALRGDVARADELYRAQLPRDARTPDYANITILRAEARVFARDWRGAETLLSALVRHQPTHQRARALLAWVLEAGGELDRELALRAVIAEEWGDHARKLVHYARALERSYDYRGALSRYQKARSLGARNVDGAIERLARRLAPEVAAGVVARDDPSGSILTALAGAAIPIRDRLTMVLAIERDAVDDGQATTMDSTHASMWALYTTSRGSSVAAGATARDAPDTTADFGAAAAVRTRPGAVVQLHARASWNTPWLESSTTIRERGVVHSVDGQLYVTPSPRLVLSLATQVRRLGLRATDDQPTTFANQLFGAAGVDVLLHAAPSRAARGQLLDHQLMWPTHFSDATLVSYRHYELRSTDPFGARLELVDRSSVDELSATLRRVIDRRGRLALSADVGAGYDRLRSAMLWRSGAAVLLSPIARSRLSIEYAFASESGTGITGRRHTARFVLHVDL